MSAAVVPAKAGAREHHRTPFISQLGEADCGPAALTAVLHSFSIRPTLSQVSRLCGVGRDGASLGDLVRVAESHGVVATGLRVNLRGDAGDARRLAAIPTPAIAQVDSSHFVVIEGVRRGTVLINDPALGRSALSVERFAQRAGGLLLAFTAPNPADQAAASVRRRWRLPVHRTRRAERGWALWSWWQSEPRGVSVLACVAVLLGVAAVAVTLTVTTIVRSVAREGIGNGNGPWIVLWALAVGAIAANWAQRRIRSAILLRSATRRGGNLVHTLLGLPAAYFHTRFTGELASRSQRVDGACLQVAGIVVGGGTQIVAAIGALGGVLVLSPSAAPLLLAGMAASLSLQIRDMDAESTNSTQSLTEKAGRDGDIVSSLVAIETVKAEAASGRLLAGWSSSQHRSLRLGELSAHRSQRRRRVSAAIDQLTVLGVVVFVGAGALGAPHEPATLIILMILASVFQTSAGGVVQQGIFDATGVRAAMRMVEDIEDAAGAGGAVAQPAETTGCVSDHVVPCPASVRLQGVSIGYHPFRPPLLATVDLSVPAGRITFITGRTGSGKSTLAKVITGTITARAGELTFGPGRHRTRPTISYVPQRPVLLEGTVADNVLFGAPEALSCRLSEALELACLTEVMAVRGGPVHASVSQDGANFSGGERQRIALARALLRRPELLVLDEATSSMEEPLEQEIFERLRRTGITIVSVAHRLPALDPADQVVHVRDGAVRVLRIDTVPAATTAPAADGGNR